MIWAGVILALRLDSSGTKKGEFRTGHPQTLNKNAVAAFMNSRCQVLHPQIYFLLWFLFKKGCACVMSSSWWGLAAQHYATRINPMLCRSPWHGTVRSSTWGQPCFGASRSFCVCLTALKCTDRDSICCLFSQRANCETCPSWFSFQSPQNLLCQDILVSFGTELSFGTASPSRKGRSCECR